MLKISLCHHIPHSKHIYILLFVEPAERTDGSSCAGNGEGDEEEIGRAEGGIRRNYQTTPRLHRSTD